MDAHEVIEAEIRKAYEEAHMRLQDDYTLRRDEILNDATLAEDDRSKLIERLHKDYKNELHDLVRERFRKIQDAQQSRLMKRSNCNTD